jgi:hypothetical protein
MTKYKHSVVILVILFRYGSFTFQICECNVSMFPLNEPKTYASQQQR